MKLYTFDGKMVVKFKKLDPNAVVPFYSTSGSAGLDLTAISKEWDEKHQVLVMGTGLAFEIPEGHVGFLFPRSSIYKHPLMLSSSVGVVDADYRGEVKFMFRPIERPRQTYEIGDRVGQLVIMPFPQIALREAKELSDSERGDKGYGSSGR